MTKVMRAVAARMTFAVRALAGKAQEIADRALESRWATAMAGSQSWSSVGSLVLHGVIILGCLINWHLHFRSNNSAIPPLVPVDLVTIADETNIAPMVREQLAGPEKDRNVAPAAPAAPPEAAPTFEMKLFPSPPSPPSSNSKKSDQVGESSASAVAPSSAPRKAMIGDHDIVGFGDETAMTMSLIDALRNQIAKCWRPDNGAEGTAVSFEMVLDANGSVERPPRLLGQSGPSTAAIAEGVRRAIYTCAPYKLPINRFREWHQITLTFDPTPQLGHAGR